MSQPGVNGFGHQPKAIIATIKATAIINYHLFSFTSNNNFFILSLYYFYKKQKIKSGLLSNG